MKARTSMWWVVLGGLALAGPARAQTFPPDTAWIPFACGNRPMTDGLRDQSAAVDERDLVGDVANPAGFRSADEQFLYLRLRVDDAPTLGANLRPFAWGYAFSTNPLPDDYEVLVTLDGDTRTVGLYRNTVISLPNSPTDPGDSPPVATYPFATHARTLAADTTFRNTRDHFIDLAVPWTALTPLGLGERQEVLVWAASSSRPDRLDGDFACHDARGGSGVPDLRSSASDSAPASGGSGGGAGAGGAGGSTGAGGASLEGGPACSATGTGSSAPPMVLLVVALLARRCARRR
jgi:hypothetical protein